MGANILAIIDSRFGYYLNILSLNLIYSIILSSARLNTYDYRMWYTKVPRYAQSILSANRPGKREKDRASSSEL